MKGNRQSLILVSPTLILVSLTLVLAACQDDPPPPTFPPELGPVEVVCADSVAGELALVERVDVTVSDPDSDLLSDTVSGFINGLPMTFTDDDADAVFSWTPPDSFDPPLVCSGEFNIVVAAQDAEGQTSEDTFAVNPN